MKPPSELMTKRKMKKMSDYEISSSLNKKITALQKKMSSLETSLINGKQAHKYSYSYGLIEKYIAENELGSKVKIQGRKKQQKLYYRFNKNKINKMSRQEQENILLHLEKINSYYGLTKTQVMNSLENEAKTRSESTGEDYNYKDIMKIKDAMRLWREKVPAAMREGGSSSILFDSDSMVSFISENLSISKKDIEKLLDDINFTFGEDSPEGMSYTQADFELWLDNYNYEESRPEVAFTTERGEQTNLLYNPLTGDIYDHPSISEKYKVYSMYNPTTGFSETYLMNKEGELKTYEEVMQNDNLFNNRKTRKNK